MTEEKCGRVIKIQKYYGSLGNMLKKYDRFSRQNAFQGNTVEEYEAWKKEARNILLQLIGLNKMDSVSLEPQIEERIVLENGIIREKVLIQSEEDVWIPMYILIPQGEKLKVFITPPGHQGAGKYSVAGRKDIPAVAEAIKKFNMIMECN